MVAAIPVPAERPERLISVSREHGVLAVYAHPDDEAHVGGTMAHFRERGVPVTLICATRGEVGEISDESLATPETLGYVRELELRAAMAQLGVLDVRFLDYRDSGMEGTPENEDRRSFHQAPAEEAVERIVRVMRDARPRIVLTWEPGGGYGHPDHIACHNHTVAAFDAAGDAGAYPEAGEPWQPDELYYGRLPIKKLGKAVEELEKRGLLPDDFPQEFRDRLREAREEPDPVISVRLDARPYDRTKHRSAGMHRSQWGEGSIFAGMPDDLRQLAFGDELFYRMRPEWPEEAEPSEGFE